MSSEKIKSTHLSRPSSFTVVSTFAYFCCLVILVGNLKNAEKTNVSSTVNCGKSISSCVTKPILQVEEKQKIKVFAHVTKKGSSTLHKKYHS